jgi:quercetin dioxygenase-like cupin family protein
MTTTQPDVPPILRATAHLPWQEVSPGFQLKLLHGATDADTRALLLRLEPGTVVQRHRHGGEVHAVNLQGSRRLDTGEVVGPGGYVHEPAGNEDSWEAIGDEPVVVFVTVRGAMETLDGAGRPVSRSTTASIAEGYRRFVAEQRR